MKSFSTTSLVEEVEKEDKIKELEDMVETQKSIIERQFQKIMALEEDTAKLKESNELTNSSVLINEEIQDEKCLTEDYNNAEVLTEEELNDSSTIENMKNQEVKTNIQKICMKILQKVSSCVGHAGIRMCKTLGRN